MQNTQKIKPKTNDFALSTLKGNIGRAIVETYLIASKYEIYPFGYEYHFVNVTRYIRKSDSDNTMAKLRNMPDLLVYDRTSNETYLLEIKASSTRDESKCLISKPELDNYIKYWPEAILVVYCIPTGKIYCRRIKEIQPESFEQGILKGTYSLKLHDFTDLPTYFTRLKTQEYDSLRKEVIDVLRSYRLA